MSHHYSGPDFGFPHGDARLDLTDLYAFPKPSEADKSILIMNVHPSAVVNPPGSTTREPFAPKALYELKIDTNGDAVAKSASPCRCAPRSAFARRASQSSLCFASSRSVARTPRGSFHAPICAKPAITLSRKDWHSNANGAVV
jgi:hypothetical protein